MREIAKKVIRIVAGTSLIVLGIVGLFLPFLQGIALIILGLWVLSKDIPWAKKLRRDLHEWYEGYKARRAERADRKPQ